MPFRHVAFFIKCRARGCGICSCSGGRPQLFRAILSIASSKTGVRDHRSRQKWSEMPGFCLPHPPKRPRMAPEVDKNRAKSLNFVYRPARPPKPRGLVSCHIGKCCQNQPARGPSSQRLIQMQHRITVASKSTGFCKKKNRRKSDGS